MKRFATILLALVLSSLMLTTKAAGNIQCVLNIMPRMGEIATNPVGVFMEFSACAGDQTWNLMAPFLGGAIRPIVVSINTLKEGETDTTVSANFETGFTNLELYNVVMEMLKQAVGELLGFIDAKGFAY